MESSPVSVSKDISDCVGRQRPIDWYPLDLSLLWLANTLNFYILGEATRSWLQRGKTTGIYYKLFLTSTACSSSLCPTFRERMYITVDTCTNLHTRREVSEYHASTFDLRTIWANVLSRDRLFKAVLKAAGLREIVFEGFTLSKALYLLKNSYVTDFKLYVLSPDV